ncbi:hypothetical protein BUALT_Bualt14G0083400 [Buddleja alternifolia]|uniref:Uncharacterized protein n=1 Tax=Buddleja alternifolia TaxID=168488 RepID=A0AAV6WSZ9_9LAMI|nr:hypothetical protein BUALT_Bualt14G0083400 [Buddleja alternifolia]
MDQQPKQSPSPRHPSPPPPPPELHRSDADEDDESVKQLRECSSVYLALQVCSVCVCVDISINWIVWSIATGIGNPAKEVLTFFSLFLC